MIVSESVLQDAVQTDAKFAQDDVRGALQIVQAKAGSARLSGDLLRQRRHMDEAHGQRPAAPLQSVADAVEQVVADIAAGVAAGGDRQPGFGQSRDQAVHRQG